MAKRRINAAMILAAMEKRYTLTGNDKEIKLVIETEHLDGKNKEKLEAELEKVMKKYL
ncbi:MAG: hypothetical protein JW682_00525 [Campylobacterales bacterium]|nr:hypothetical protein [Campylobacterales bacterium]